MKRGMNPLTVIITLVIGSLMLMLLISFLKSYVVKLSHYGESDFGCKASVIAAANTKVSGAEHIVSVGTKEIGKSDYAIDCPADEITLSGDDSALKLAENMRGCWEKFGEGKLNPFPDWDPRGLDTQNICAVCSIVDLKVDIDNFDNFLASNKMYKSDITYLDYFTDGKTAKSFGDSFDLKYDSTGKVKYTTLFMLHKSKDPNNFWKAFGVATVLYGVPSLAASFISPVPYTSVVLGGAALYSAYSAGVEYEDKYKQKYSASIMVVPYETYQVSKPIKNEFGEQRDVYSSIQGYCDTLAVDVEGARK